MREASRAQSLISSPSDFAVSARRSEGEWGAFRWVSFIVSTHVRHTNTLTWRCRNGEECNVKCLAVAAKNALGDSAVIMIGMDKMTRQINAKCIADDGSPGAAGHGTSCFPLKTIKFITPCNVKKDLYD